MNQDVFNARNGQFLNIPPSSLKVALYNVDSDTGERIGYQRDRDLRQIAAQIEDNFDGQLFDPPVVSRRSTDFGWTAEELGDWVIDGQGRQIAAEHKGLTSIPCRVLTGLTLADEKKIFVMLQTGRKNLSKAQIWAVEAGMPGRWENDVDKTLISYGIYVGSSSQCPKGCQPFQLSAGLQSLNKAFETLKSKNATSFSSTSELVEESVKFLRKAFPGDYPNPKFSPINSATIEATGLFLLENSDWLYPANINTLSDIIAGDWTFKDLWKEVLAEATTNSLRVTQFKLQLTTFKNQLTNVIKV